MKIAVFGSGYVGLVTGACFADFGNHVTLIDIDATKVASLNDGKIPIYEPGLSEMVLRNKAASRMVFTTQAEAGLNGAEIVFVAVSTPEGENGQADLRFVEAVAKTVNQYMTKANPARKPLFVLKSTVPVGTADKCRGWLLPEIDVVSNPEFLKEGSALNDFLRPERVVVGAQTESAFAVMRELYAPFVRAGAPVLCMSNRSAEVSKYAANSFLAMKVSFINDLALFAEAAGADVYDVRGVLRTDSRIGAQFLHPGAGYGGSCFPKDVRALATTAAEYGHPLPLVEATHEINNRQRLIMPQRIQAFLEQADCTQGTIALWGVSFKPETDDIRESAALVLIDELCAKGHKILAFDPQGLGPLKRQRADLIATGRLVLAADALATLKGADILAVMTEWNEFRSPDFRHIASALSLKAIFDGKNLFRQATLARYGLKHFGIGLSAFDPRIKI